MLHALIFYQDWIWSSSSCCFFSLLHCSRLKSSSFPLGSGRFPRIGPGCFLMIVAEVVAISSCGSLTVFSSGIPLNHILLTGELSVTASLIRVSIYYTVFSLKSETYLGSCLALRCLTVNLDWMAWTSVWSLSCYLVVYLSVS